MPFTLFTLIFLLAVVFAFYIVNVNLRSYILLLASIAYIAKYDFKSCLWMIIVSLAVFFAALIIQRLIPF